MIKKPLHVSKVFKSRWLGYSINVTFSISEEMDFKTREDAEDARNQILEIIARGITND